MHVREQLKRLICEALGGEHEIDSRVGDTLTVATHDFKDAMATAVREFAGNYPAMDARTSERVERLISEFDSALEALIERTFNEI